MASPEEIVPSLPDTLPEDFGEWDGEGSPAPTPVHSSEWEAWEAAHPVGDSLKPAAQSSERKSILSSAVEKPRDARRTSPESVFVKQQQDLNPGNGGASPAAKSASSHEWEAWEASQSFAKTAKPNGHATERRAIPSPVSDKPRATGSASSAAVLVEPQELAGELEEGSPSRASHAPEASHSLSAVAEAPSLPEAATVAAAHSAPEPAATSTLETDEALFELFSSKKLEVKEEPKTGKKKRTIFVAVGTCAILLPAIFVIPRFHRGTKSAAAQSAQPVPEATDSPMATDTPKPSASDPITQETPPAVTEQQQATDNQPTNEGGGVKSAQVPTKTQAKMMDDQLTAPTQIPQGTSRQGAEDAPPPVSFGAGGAEEMAGSGGNASVFNANGHTQPIIRVAQSKPLAISSGVATGMLILKTLPIYPPIAKTARVSGSVELHATIAKNGTIKDLQVVNGPIMLRQAAIDAVRNWRYRPYKLNNEPTEVETTINVVFSLAG